MSVLGSVGSAGRGSRLDRRSLVRWVFVGDRVWWMGVDGRWVSRMATVSTVNLGAEQLEVRSVRAGCGLLERTDSWIGNGDGWRDLRLLRNWGRRKLEMRTLKDVLTR